MKIVFPYLCACACLYSGLFFFGVDLYHPTLHQILGLLSIIFASSFIDSAVKAYQHRIQPETVSV